MNEFYNKKGESIEMMKWGKLLEDKDYRIIKQETLPNGKWVSTVWLGLDHNFAGGKPLIFETMVFSKKGGRIDFKNISKKNDDWRDLDMDRYSTLKEAEKGHQLMVEKWRRI